MARRRSTSFGRTRQVVVVGHNAQVLPTVRLFLAGNINVRVYTSSAEIEDTLAPFPGVDCTRVGDGYVAAPPDLPDTAYIICVDKEELARRIRSWLPRTLAVFHVCGERRGKTAINGFLPLVQPASLTRKRLMRTLSTLRRVDALMDQARHAELPLILIYGDPDPDAVGAALGLASIWRIAGASPLIRFTGEVQRYQNKLLVNYVDEPVERLRDSELAGADLVAMVDAQPGFWKKDRPQVVHTIIDHHPIQPDSQAHYVDLRERCGSTCTILTEYLLEAGLPMKKRLATALLYGIVTDTADLTRNTTSADIRAYEALHQRADHHFLSRLFKSQIPLSMLDWIAWGISHRLIYRDLMLIHFGEIKTPDVLVQVADHMLLTCGITWVVCAGKIDDLFVVVFRGDGHRQDVGARAKAAFSRIGSAGGHRTMGRAEVHLRGEHVDTTVDLLVDRLFKRMTERRRKDFIRIMRNNLHGAGPSSPEMPVAG